MTIKARMNRLVALFEAGILSEDEMLDSKSKLAVAFPAE